MLCDDFTRDELSEFTFAHFAAAMTQTQLDIPLFAQHDGPDFYSKGVLWGGNLAMTTHLLGTPFFPMIEGGIFYVEDIAEHPYRVERMMLQLHMAGVLDKQAAIVMGDFSGYKLAAHDRGYDFDQMLAFLRSQTKTPIFTGLPFGHIKEKVSLWVGKSAKLYANQLGVRLVNTTGNLLV